MKARFKIIPERSLHLSREFNERDADILIGKLFELNQSKGNIFLQINSGGGSFAGSQKIYDNIALSPNPVIGVVAGDCFSGASIILQACSKRLATKNSRLLIHHVSYPIRLNIKHSDTIEGLSAKILDDMAQIKTNEEILIRILGEKLKVSTDQILQLLDKEEMMNPKKALATGLIDEII
ncbi:MAG: ATP-dependent Clp protease proteolytic subunit [Lentimicrobium sp.]|nr:ATP-dependent Clp protease proteolytic subunit [Lentimicrobium sp.]